MLQERNNKKWLYTILAFLLPVLGMFSVMLIRGFIPFGKTSMLYSDMYHQYYPFFVAFRKALRSGDSLLYNWSVGMGMDYLGLVSYYLASPLNLLSVFVPEQWLLHYFSLLVPIKLGFAGLFFSIFLKGISGKQDLSTALFGCLYAFCAWALGYQWNVMWLDTFALLPLVALGAVSLLKKRKFVLYTVSLFLSVLSNYYIGLFTCIFVVLLFVCYQICRWGGIRKFLDDLLAIILYSLIAVGMTAFLELPAYAALQTTQSSVNKFPETFQLNIVDSSLYAGYNIDWNSGIAALENGNYSEAFPLLWSGFSKPIISVLTGMFQVAGNMNGCLEPTFKEGLPNLYCGVFTNFFAFLFLTCNKVRKRDRICSVMLLVLFNISFLIKQLDYIWHGFHFTNMIPYRFSFLYSFVMLYMAYRAWLLRNRFRLWQVIVAAIPAVCLPFLGKETASPAYWAYNGVLLVLYITTVICSRIYRLQGRYISFEEKRKALKNLRVHRSIISCVLLSVLVMELVLNLVNFGVYFTGTTVSDYPRGTTYTQSMIRYMQEREEDNLFYRAETTHSQTLNDGALNGYNGISTFTSSANVKVTEFMRRLGYGAKNTYNRYCFEESSPVSNLFLNLKYMLERSDKVEENPYFNDLHQYGKVHLLENNAYLPLGFLTDNQLLNVDFSSSENTFVFQNSLFRCATGLDGDVWTLINGKNISISATGATLSSQTQTGYCSYSTETDAGGTVVFKYIAPTEGLLCIDLNLSKRNKFSFWKDGVELYNETYSIPQSLSVCQVQPGEVIEVHLTCNANEKGTISLSAGILDETLFRAGHSILSSSTLELTSFSNTRVEGTIECDRNGILYTSIPQDGNWNATIDGKPAQIVLIGDAMVGLLLPEGTHQITFYYHNAAFSLGWKLSLICLFVFTGMIIAAYLPKFRRGMYERKSR